MDPWLEGVYVQACSVGGGPESRLAEWWWCSEEALQRVGDILLTKNHTVIDHFLPPTEAEAIRQEVQAADTNGLLSRNGILGGGRRGREESYENKSLRSDTLGYFDGTENEWTAIGSSLKRVLEKMVSFIL